MSTELQIMDDQSIVPVDERAEAEVMRTIEAAVVLSRKFPRNQQAAYGGIIQACKRHSFAEGAAYKFPRGKTEVKGPSIYLARECARCWGNIRYGNEVVRMDDDAIKIRAWAWDMETNTYNAAEDEFKKLIYRKNKEGVGSWIVPDERDLRELVNRRGAITLRNCLLQLIPKDYIEDALKQATQTLQGKAQQSPQETIKGLVAAYQGLNISVEEIDEYLGHPLANATPEELVDLQQIGKSIKDGYSYKSEYFGSAPSKETSTESQGPHLTTDQIINAPVDDGTPDINLEVPLPPVESPKKATPKKAVPMSKRLSEIEDKQQPPVAAKKASNKLPPPQSPRELLEYCRSYLGITETSEVVALAGVEARTLHEQNMTEVWEKIKQAKGIDV